MTSNFGAFSALLFHSFWVSSTLYSGREVKDLRLLWLLLPESAGGSAEGPWIAAGCTAGNTFNSQPLCCVEAQARVWFCIKPSRPEECSLWEVCGSWMAFLNVYCMLFTYTLSIVHISSSCVKTNSPVFFFCLFWFFFLIWNEWFYIACVYLKLSNMHPPDNPTAGRKRQASTST